MKNTFNVVMLPTEKASSIFDKKGKLEYKLNPPLHGMRYLVWKYQHLYIISDDEIKEGDWYYDTNYNVIGIYDSSAQIGKKIVATTDKSLTILVGYNNVEESLPYIPESFIKAFVESNGTIKEVELEMEEIFWEDLKSIKGSVDDIGIRIKTNPDNTVIVHQSKMYSKDEVEKLCELAFNKGWKINQSPITEFQQWIKDNL